MTTARALLRASTLSALQATLKDLQDMYQRMEAHGWECPNRGEMMAYKLLVTRDASETLKLPSEKCAPLPPLPLRLATRARERQGWQ